MHGATNLATILISFGFSSFYSFNLINIKMIFKLYYCIVYLREKESVPQAEAGTREFNPGLPQDDRDPVTGVIAAASQGLCWLGAGIGSQRQRQKPHAPAWKAGPATALQT